MTEKPTLQAVLDCKMQPNDAGALTVSGYLLALTEGVWNEGEGFDGKRPFGNSSWEHEILDSLAAAGLVPSDSVTTDKDTPYEYTEYDLHDSRAAEKLVEEALQSARLVIP